MSPRWSPPGEYCVRGGLIDLFPMGSRCPTASTCSTTRSRPSAPSTSTPSAASIRCPRSACCRRANSRWTKPGARTSASASASASKATRRKSRSTRTSPTASPGRHRVLPAAVLRRNRHALRLPARATPPSVLHGDVAGAIDAFWNDTQSRYTCCTATARGRCCRRTNVPERRGILRRCENLRAHRHQRAASGGRQRRRHGRGRAAALAVDRRAEDPLARAESLPRSTRRPRAAARRNAGPARNHAPYLRRTRPCSRALSRPSPTSWRATRSLHARRRAAVQRLRPAGESALAIVTEDRALSPARRAPAHAREAQRTTSVDAG